MEILFVISFIFLTIRLCVAAYNLVSRPVLYSYRLEDIIYAQTVPAVSILIPTRNEEFNLPILIDSILAQSFEDFEILVLDDHSTDKTSHVVLEYQQKDKRIRLLKGEELPPNWLGKNWTCHQLALQAQGVAFLFLDADVKLEDGAIKKALNAMTEDRLALLSVFPQQEMDTVGEKMTVPIMHYLLLSMLPLDFIFLLKPSSIATANGPFMLFDAFKYNQYLFHERCKADIVEDIRIMQAVKELGLKCRTLLGNDLLKCRMYHSLEEGVSGFSKNLLVGFGKSKIGLFVYLIFTLFVPLSMCYFNWMYALVYTMVAMLMRFCISTAAKQSVISNMVLHPLQMCMLVIVAYKSMVQAGSKK